MLAKFECKLEHNRSIEEWGIYVKEMKPEISGARLYYFPFTADKCNLCGKRISMGLQPACVKHCWAGVMKFDKIEILTEHMRKKPKTVLWVAR